MKICPTRLAFVLFCCLADRVLSTSILWPSGRYGLPMPKSRCPTGNGFYWISGHIYQDLENNASATTVSPNAHLLGSVSNDVSQFFCIKNQTSTALDNNRKPWPEGQYCIYRKGSSCPAGMLSGSVLWDNENANGMNKNAHQGCLPAGVYNQDTKIFFCCKISGRYDTPIELPTDKPFYLIAYEPHCQEVLNTVHTMEFIVYDTEDDNNHDKTTFPYPHGAKMPEPHIYYCYYQACLWTLTTLSGTFTSPYYPQDYKNMAACTWHISVPWNYTISLTFKDFTTERTCCECDYVEVWETHKNGSAVLIDTFCSDQRKPDPFKPINSSSNNVTVVFHSDYSVNEKGFQASYEAIPVAASFPTANNIETSTTTLPQATTNTTTPGKNSSSTPTFESTIKQNNTTPLLFTTTSTRRSSSAPRTEIATKETSTTEPGTSTTTTDTESVHEARNKSAATENVYVIVGVIASLIVIGGAVAGTVLCFCKKCHIKRSHTDRDRLAVTFKTEEKTEIGISNVSLPDMYGGSVSEGKDEERYTDINKLENVNVLYDSGDGVTMSEKDDVKESDNPLYASSFDTVKESDNPMYESMDDVTLKDEIDAGIDPLYERMV